MAVWLYTWFAVVAAGFASLETFGRIESAQAAALLWGLFLLVLGVGHTAILLIHRRPTGWGSWWWGNSVTALIAGGVTALASGWGLDGLVTWSMGVWALIAGATTVVQGLRLEKGSERSDWLLVGGATLALAVVTLVVPAGIVWVMGMAGVWASILTVFLGIGAVNLGLAGKRQRSA